MPSPPGTRPGSHCSTLSSSLTTPSSTNCSRTTATKGLAMLPVRKAVSAVTGVPRCQVGDAGRANLGDAVGAPEHDDTGDAEADDLVDAGQRVRDRRRRRW